MHQFWCTGQQGSNVTELQLKVNERNGDVSPAMLMRSDRLLALKNLLLFNIIRLEFAITFALNNYGPVLRRNKMRHARRDDDETASRVRFQLCRVESRSHAQIPGSFDDGDWFVLRMRMCADMF